MHCSLCNVAGRILHLLTQQTDPTRLRRQSIIHSDNTNMSAFCTPRRTLDSTQPPRVASVDEREEYLSHKLA